MCSKDQIVYRCFIDEISDFDETRNSGYHTKDAHLGLISEMGISVNCFGFAKNQEINLGVESFCYRSFGFYIVASVIVVDICD